MTAMVTPQPPITYTYTPGSAAVIPEAKPLAEPTPAPRVSVPVAESTRDAAVVEPAAEPAAEPAVPAAELPQTASPLPLFAFGGFASLVLGLGAGLLRRRLN
jgi:LPXTG-motif cell wall-anchored protein